MKADVLKAFFAYFIHFFGLAAKWTKEKRDIPGATQIGWHWRHWPGCQCQCGGRQQAKDGTCKISTFRLVSELCQEVAWQGQLSSMISAHFQTLNSWRRQKWSLCVQKRANQVSLPNNITQCTKLHMTARISQFWRQQYYLANFVTPYQIVPQCVQNLCATPAIPRPRTLEIPASCCHPEAASERMTVYGAVAK